MNTTTTTPTLAARFSRNTFVLRSATPLAEDQMRHAAPSIFAAGKHGSRSERYTLYLQAAAGSSRRMRRGQHGVYVRPRACDVDVALRLTLAP